MEEGGRGRKREKEGDLMVDTIDFVLDFDITLYHHFCIFHLWLLKLTLGRTTENH